SLCPALATPAYRLPRSFSSIRPAPSLFFPLSLHDALPISVCGEDRRYLSEASHFRLYDCHWFYVHVGIQHCDRRGYVAYWHFSSAAHRRNRRWDEKPEEVRYRAHAGYRLLCIDRLSGHLDWYPAKCFAGWLHEGSSRHCHRLRSMDAGGYACCHRLYRYCMAGTYYGVQARNGSHSRWQGAHQRRGRKTRQVDRSTDSSRNHLPFGSLHL